MSPLITQIDPYGIWHITLFWGLAWITVAFIYRQPKWIPWPAKVLWGWVLVNALMTLEFPSISYGENHTAFMASAGQTFAEALLIPLAAIYFPGGIKKALLPIVLLELFAVFFAPQGRGLMHQRSFDLAFLALCLPLLHWSLGLLTLIGMASYHCGTALGILGGQLAIYGYSRGIWGKIAIILGLVALGALAYGHSHGPLLDGAERFQLWGRFFGYWTHDLYSTLFGMGAGSFMWVSLIAEKFQPPRFLSAHNDWLQLGFDSGVIGVGLALATLVYAWKRTSGDPKRRGAVIGAAIFGLTYQPLRFFPSALITALIFRNALIKDADVDHTAHSTGSGAERE